MTTNQKETMLNKVLQLESWLEGYLCDIVDELGGEVFYQQSSEHKLLININRNLNSIKSLIKKS